MPEVSIIMPNYNGLKMGVLSGCLTSVLQSNFSDFELLVIDNGSKDGSVDFLKDMAQKDSRVRPLLKHYNWGYSGANNEAVPFARGQLLCFLHNDTQVDADWLGQLISVISSDAKIGAVQPQIRDLKDRTVILSEGNRIDRLGFIHVDRRGERSYSQGPPHAVFAATAACMLFRKCAYDDAGGFDPSFFLSYDEVDLCWRTWLAGYAVYCVPQALVWHCASTTVNTFFRSELSYFDARNRLKSIVKNYSFRFLAKYLLPSTIASVFESTRRSFENNDAEIVGTARAIIEMISSLEEILRKRRLVQSRRTLKDSDLLREGLIIPINFAKLFRRSV